MIESIKNYTPIIHQDAFVHERACIIGQVTIDSGASIWPGAILRGDMGLIRVGKNSSVQDGTICHMTMGFSTTQIGNNVTIGHGVILHGCLIEDDCLIGMGSILLDGVVIGAGSFVAAGSLVTGNKKFANGSFIQGRPAQCTRPVNEKEQAMIQFSVAHYLSVVANYSRVGS